MSQPCSAIELVLFDARDLTVEQIRRDVGAVVDLGILTGALAASEHVADMVDAAGQADRFSFWFGGSGNWPFERAIAFANVEPGRVLFVSNDQSACDAASALGLRLYDDRTTDIVALLP